MKNNVLIKICGNVFKDQSLIVAEAGPDIMGWILAKVSPRCVSPESASSYISEIRKLFPRIRHAAVFAKNSAEDILGLLKRAGPGTFDFLQIHGGPDLLHALRASRDAYVNVPIIPVVPVDPEGSFVTDADLEAYGEVPFYLFDTYSPKAPGGTGIRFPLRLIERVTKPYFIAGGLNPDNVSEVLKQCSPAGIDASSGLETSPGIKDPVKLNKFINIIRNRE